MAAFSTIAALAMTAASVAMQAKAAKAAKSAIAPSSSTNPADERKQAETEAAQRSNSRLAAKTKARAASSLAAPKPLDSTSSDVAALGGAAGKSTLGG